MKLICILFFAVISFGCQSTNKDVDASLESHRSVAQENKPPPVSEEKKTADQMLVDSCNDLGGEMVTSLVCPKSGNEPELIPYINLATKSCPTQVVPCLGFQDSSSITRPQEL